jgi:hydroxypyruvate isomerase
VEVTRRTAMAATLAAGSAGAATAQPRGRAPAGAAALANCAVNLDTWFTQHPFEQRFALAAKLGFKKLEFWPARRDGFNAARIRKLADDAGLVVEQFAPGAPAFSDPGKHPELMRYIEEAIADARTLGCRHFTVVGHAVIPDMSREDMVAGYTAGLMRIAPVLEKAGMVALVEPFNRVNHQNHLLNGSRPAVAMIRAVNSPAVKLNWDFYHMQLEDGDLIDKFAAAQDAVGYVQIGDNPGRHEPGTGEVHHGNLLRAVRRVGYKGAIGLEFFPADKNDERAARTMAALAAEVNL